MAGEAGEITRRKRDLAMSVLPKGKLVACLLPWSVRSIVTLTHPLGSRSRNATLGVGNHTGASVSRAHSLPYTSSSSHPLRTIKRNPGMSRIRLVLLEINAKTCS
ncbi:hypothetical protein OE88DRAFT_1662400 [Heliocybe sulcata]|uniref:Uncharacterized protein n=1 Tax=Heliocybe sulcata TaxID=5364 RepID=A0A5C3MXX6_9AGAM|nr:hypothetical protein OE88DRAFT_1662400 [Heliocybe sulcata]